MTNYKSIISTLGGTGTGVAVDPSILNEAVSSIISILSGIAIYLLTSWFEKLKNKGNNGPNN